MSATGDALLAFPTDAPGQPTSWHGALHLAGVLVANAGTIVVARRTVAGDRRPRLVASRFARRPQCSFAATAVGVGGGFDVGLGQDGLRGRDHAAGGGGAVVPCTEPCATGPRLGRPACSPEPGLADRLREVPRVAHALRLLRLAAAPGEERHRHLDDARALTQGLDRDLRASRTGPARGSACARSRRA